MLKNKFSLFLKFVLVFASISSITFVTAQPRRFPKKKCDERITSQTSNTALTEVELKAEVEKILTAKVNPVDFETTNGKDVPLYLIEVIEVAQPSFLRDEQDFFGVLGMSSVSSLNPTSAIIAEIHKIGASVPKLIRLKDGSIIRGYDQSNDDYLEELSEETIITSSDTGMAMGVELDIRVPFKVKGNLEQIYQVLLIPNILKAKALYLDLL